MPGWQDPSRLLLTTERMTVRLPRRGDEEALAGYYRENRGFLQPWSPRFEEELFHARCWPERIDAIRAEYRSGRGMRLCFFPHEGGAMLGMASVTAITGFPTYTGNLGYSMDEHEQGKGLMTEALQVVVAHCFGPMGLHRIEANYMPRNHASARVLEKLGFVIEGLSAGYCLIAGVWEDHVRTAIVNPLWPLEESAAMIPNSDESP